MTPLVLAAVILPPFVFSFQLGKQHQSEQNFYQWTEVFCMLVIAPRLCSHTMAFLTQQKQFLASFSLMLSGQGFCSLGALTKWQSCLPHHATHHHPLQDMPSLPVPTSGCHLFRRHWDDALRNKLHLLVFLEEVRQLG